MKSTLDLRLQGHVAANRDAIVKITQEATGASQERKPFLDGSLLVRDLDPGFYEVEVRHPNLIDVIDRRRVRIFPTLQPTRVFVPIPADLFRDTPIRDIPDADLGPVQQLATSARTVVQPMGAKIAGEAIRASDWNTLAGAVADLATCVLELTRLVAPRGHDHPEIAEKIGEVQQNMKRFAESFGRSLLELRREIETENLRTQVTDVLDRANADADTRSKLLGRLSELELSVQTDTLNFTRKLSTTGSVLLNTVNELAVAQGANADAFLSETSVQKLTGVARQYADAGTQTKAENELLTYQKSTSVGGSKLGTIIGR